eukprot:Nitzschia sp. Nitz4//scaffold195_size40117//30054//32752//NITZ4_007579-RA/size40117-processed-gene-0.28-mRNA-1//-1//CDS//3329540374//2660//frame0
MVVVSSINPPFPEQNSKQTSSDNDVDTQKTPGQRLLTLTRQLENNPESYDAIMEETVELMNSLIEMYSRRGLLLGDTDKAQRILSSRSLPSQAVHNSKAKSKSHADVENGQVQAAQSETLVFSALTRILNSQPNSLGAETNLLVALAAEICTAIGQHMQRGNQESAASSSVLAEYEILVQSGKPILSGLVSRVQSIQSELSQGNLNVCLANAMLDDDQHVTPLVSCFKAASLYVNLFGTKLSRSTDLLSKLRSISWQFLSAPMDSVQQAASHLFTSLPFAGAIDRKSPADLWNGAFADLSSVLFRLVDSIAPVGKSSIRLDTIPLSEEANAVVQQWHRCIQQTLSEPQARVDALVVLLRGTSMCVRNLLLMDSLSVSPSDSIPVDTCVPIETVLDVVESFLSYPMSAESLFYRTKKRLRDETVDGGYVTSRAIALQLANVIKGIGHMILESLLTALGGPILFPYGKRIIRVSYASLLTSCSQGVRRVMDPASSVQLEGKKRRWLHLSVVMRTKSVQSLQRVILSFGSDRTAKTNTSTRTTGDNLSDMEMALALVVGCLIEQTTENAINSDECWGNTEERLDYVLSCLDCLRGALSSAGGYLGPSIRAMIDSVVLNCLSQPSTSKLGDVFSWWSVRAKVFDLARSSVVVPWNDGGASSLVDSLQLACHQALQEGDETVGLAARDALLVCNQFRVPRAPALVNAVRVPPESQGKASGAPETSASMLRAKLEQVEKERAAAQKAMEKVELEAAAEKRKRSKEEPRMETKKTKTQVKPMVETSTPKPAAAKQEKPQVAVEKELPVPEEENSKNHAVVPVESEKVKSVGETTSMGEEDMKLTKDEKDDSNEQSMDVEPEFGDDDEDFPEIVAGDGPDSDDED